MSEMMDTFAIWTELFDWIFLIFRGYCLFFFYGNFLHRRGGKGSRRDFVWLWLFFVVVKRILDRLTESVGIEGYSDGRMILKLVVLYGALFLATCFFFEGKRGFLAFVTVTYVAVSEITTFFAYTVWRVGEWGIAFCENLYEQGRFGSIEEYIAALLWIEAALQLFTSLTQMAFMFFLLSYIVKTYRSKNYPLHRTELFFLLLPNVTGILFCILLRVILVSVEEQMPLFLYDRYPVLTGIVPMLLLLCMFSMTYSIKLFQNMISLHEEQRRLVLLEKQVDSMEEYIGETERVYSGVRAMKHDMRNQLTVLSELARRGEEEALQAYLGEMNQTLNGLDFPWRTGSAVVDTLLAIKYHEAQERIPGLRFETEELVIPSQLRIRAMDLSVILGNGLDNAIEACEALRAVRRSAEPFIRMAAMWKDRFFLLEITNSFEGKLLCGEGEELPRTTKADDVLHGIGLRSIQTTAEKYHGGVDWSAENGVFTLTVLLKNEAV